MPSIPWAAGGRSGRVGKQCWRLVTGPTTIGAGFTPTGLILGDHVIVAGARGCGGGEPVAARYEELLDAS